MREDGTFEGIVSRRKDTPAKRENRDFELAVKEYTVEQGYWIL